MSILAIIVLVAGNAFGPSFGFLLANPTIWNIAMVVGADLALMRRAVCEEQTLAKDDAYRAYQQGVRWRVLPGVF